MKSSVLTNTLQISKLMFFTESATVCVYVNRIKILETIRSQLQHLTALIS